MDWAELARRAPSWAAAPDSAGRAFPFVVHTRFFSYRNFAGEPFPVSASPRALASVAEKAGRPLLRWGTPETFRLAECPPPVLRMLRERGLLAEPSLPLGDRKEFKLLALPRDRAEPTGDPAARWAWVDEVEHLTFAGVVPGMPDKEDFAAAFPLPQEDSDHQPWAWTARHGYLASDPARIGPGFAAEILAHLPALALSRRLGYARNAMAALGVAFAPVTRMETDKMESALFRFRSGGALGLSAPEAYGIFTDTVSAALRLEAEAQRRLLEKHRKRLEDRVEHSLRFLSEAAALGYPEFLAAASYVRLGAYTGVIKPQIPSLLEVLRITSQTGHLQVSANRIPTKEEEDIMRANVVRLTLERRHAA
jgi:protein arginine kinase